MISDKITDHIYHIYWLLKNLNFMATMHLHLILSLKDYWSLSFSYYGKVHKLIIWNENIFKIFSENKYPCFQTVKCGFLGKSNPIKKSYS